jgi:hypothetical protein
METSDYFNQLHMRGGLARPLAFGQIRLLLAMPEDRGCRRIRPESVRVVRKDRCIIQKSYELVKYILKRLLVSLAPFEIKHRPDFFFNPLDSFFQYWSSA